MFVCFLYAIVTLLFMLVLHKLCFYKEAVLRCFMLISLFFTSSKKGDNSSNRMGGLVRSTFQEVQRIHELEFLNASFMLSLHLFLWSVMWFLQGLWYTKAAILYGFMILGLFHAPSKKEVDSRNRMGGLVRSTFQKVERIHELEFFVCFFYAIITLSFMRFLQGLCYDKDVSKEVVLR